MKKADRIIMQKMKRVGINAEMFNIYMKSDKRQEVIKLKDSYSIEDGYVCFEGYIIE